MSARSLVYAYRAVDGYRGFGIGAILHVGVYRWAGRWRMEVVLCDRWFSPWHWRWPR